MTKMDFKKQAFYHLLTVKATIYNLYATGLNKFYFENLNI